LIDPSTTKRTKITKALNTFFFAFFVRFVAMDQFESRITNHE